jgi:hypothetical protein
MMFRPQYLERVLNPHGLYTKVRLVPVPGGDSFKDLKVPVERVVPEEDWYEFTFHGWKPGRNPKKISCTVLVPFPRSVRGVFWWGDRQRVVVSRCYPNIMADPGREDWRFDRQIGVLTRELQKIFAAALRDFYFTGNPPSSSGVRSRIARLFTSSKWCPVLPDGSVGRKSLRELVYMDLPETIDLSVLSFPKKLFGVLDPCSTSNGDKINRVYRLCQGVKIEKDGTAAPSGTDFCSTLADNAIGIDLVPHRVNTLRTAFEASLDLVNPEKPWVCGEMHDLSGVHLNTAVMDLKWWTWEDCIAISESAARRLQAIRTVQEVVETFTPMELKVKEGDSIMPGGQVLGIGLSRENKRQVFKATKVRHSGWIDRITASPTYMLGRPAIRYRFYIVSHVDAKTGDKVTTRAGTKGVLKVLPDHMMPITEDGTRIDCCVSPVSIVPRKAMLALWEMMANKRQARKDERLIMHHLTQLHSLKPTFKQLVSWGFGRKQQLWVRRQQLPEQTFVGPLYFIRVDKLAREIASVQEGKRPKNHHDIPVNSARLSGQRRDLAKAMAMSGRNLHSFLEHTIREDVSGTSHVRSVASVLEPERYL